MKSDFSTIKEAFKEEAHAEGERRTLFALWAAKSALFDAGIQNFKGDRNHFGVSLAAGLGINRPEDISQWVDQSSKRLTSESSAESINRFTGNQSCGIIQTEQPV